MAAGNQNIPLKISRRSILRAGTTALAAGGAFALGMVLRPAEAAAKVSKEDAGYQDTPKGEERCQSCKNFLAPSSCALVEGDISPHGWCKLYSKKA